MGRIPTITGGYLKGRLVQKGVSGGRRHLRAWKPAWWALFASVLVHGGLVGFWGGDQPRLRWGMKAAASNTLGVAYRHMAGAAPGEPQAVVVVSAGMRAAAQGEPGQAAHGRAAAPQPLADAPTHATTHAPAASPNAVSPMAAPEGHQRSALPTRIPADFVQSLIVSRGSHTGAGQWSWSVAGGRYRSELTAQLNDQRSGQRAQRGTPGPQADALTGTAALALTGSAAPALNWSSAGGLDSYGVAPERFLTQPAKGGARAVNFQRDTGRVTYSGPTGQAGLVPGAQDRLSWLVQLLALAHAHPLGQGLPAEMPLWVAGPQGDAGDWWFAVQWHPATSCWQFTRRAERRYDVQVQAWVAVGSTAQLIRLEMGPEGGRQAPWLLRDAERPQACGHPP